MRNIRRPSLLSAALLTLWLGTYAHPASAQRFEHEQVVEESFEVRPGQTLTLDADLGSIDVRGSSGDEVRVTVIKGANDVSRGDAEALFERYDVDFRETGIGIEVRGRYDRGSWWRRNPLQVRYEISVPQNFNVDLETAGGSIHLAGIDGEARIETSGGSLTVENVGGPVEAKTSGGSITAERIRDHASLRTSGGSITVEDVDGTVEAHTSGGSIRVADARGEVEAHTSGGGIRLTGITGAVEAHTSGGSIEAEVVGQPGRPMSLETSGGSVSLVLDRDVRADVEARASGGRVRVDLPLTVRGEIKRDYVAGTLNGGGPLITLRSSGGGVSIREH